MRRGLVLVAALAAHGGTAAAEANQTLEYLLELTASSRPHWMAAGGPAAPGGVAFDCSWRKLAMAYAPKLQALSAAKAVELHDALELSALCGVAQPPQPAPSRSHASRSQAPAPGAAAAADDAIISVSPTGAVKTLEAALAKARGMSCRPGCAVTIEMGSGIYRLKSAPSAHAGLPAASVVLTPADSGITIAAAAGVEDAVLSGGVELQGLAWKASPGNPKARFPNANPEIDLFPKGYITAKTEWMAPVYPPNNPSSKPCADPDGTLCGPSKTLTIPVAGSEWHGMYQNFTVGYGGACDVYDPPVSPWCSEDFYLVRQFKGGGAMHTRHPSGLTPGTKVLPNAPYKNATGAHVFAWRPGHWYTWMFEVAQTTPGHKVPGNKFWSIEKNSNAVFGMLTNGAGKDSPGVKYLGDFLTWEACWAACNASEATPCTAFTYGPFNGEDKGCYQPLTTHTQRYTQGVRSGYGPTPDSESAGSLLFGRGGNQGGEGNDAAGEWYIENVYEELDAENEYWYDTASRELHFWYNSSTPGAAPPTSVVVPALANMIVIKGSKEEPVHNISIRGLQFRDNRPTYMEPRTNPSGGDWALERQGAVLIEGCIGCAVEANKFHHLDTNAVFLSGYNRGAVISGNEFVWLGQNAIASWGYLDGETESTMTNSGMGGLQPRGTLIEGNWVHEIGHIQKQSSFYFQAITAETTIQKNVVFNIPRAGINFNDGFGGGNVIKDNLLFNTCRESSDHGAFNSWDRLPYVTDVRVDAGSTIPAVNDVHNNFIVANYAADGGCLDNDDGSSYYHIHHNFCVYGGHKGDFDGNKKISSDNIHAYPSVYGTTCLNIGAQALPPAGYAEGYYNNKCILPVAGAPYLKLGGIAGPVEDTAGGEWPSTRKHLTCLAGKPGGPEMTAFQAGITLGNNTLYVPGGEPTVSCGKIVKFSEFQAQGYDPTSRVVSTLPTNDTIIGWAKQLLSL